MGSVVEEVEQTEKSSTLISDFKQLTNMGLSMSVVFSSVAGYLLAVDNDAISYYVIFLLAIGG